MEGNDYSESAGDLVGLTFGGPGDSLVDHAQTWDAVSVWDTFYDMAYPGDTFEINDSGVAQEFDGTAVYNATVTFIDGSTANVTAVVAQDTDGNTYWVPEYSDNTDHATMQSAPIQSVTFDSLNSNYAYGLNVDRMDPTFITCFTSGTRITTQSGQKPIETLSVGDKILTMDHGFQEIRWIGTCQVQAEGAFAPILIQKGALDNDSDLLVSPQHRMLYYGPQCEMLFGVAEVLIPAKHLVNDLTIRPKEGGMVTYYHLMFDTHEIIYAENCPSESFHPGEFTLDNVAQDTRDELLALFPELAIDKGLHYGATARQTIKPYETNLLLNSED